MQPIQSVSQIPMKVLLSNALPSTVLSSYFRKLILAFLVILSASLTGCIHKPDIQQGNVITQEVVAELAIGMKQNQVQSIAGKPLILDPFRSDRWEYVYSMKYDNHKQSQFSYVTLFFDGDKLSDIKIHQQPLKEDDIRSIETSSRSQLF